jgi:hypothetical protein
MNSKTIDEIAGEATLDLIGNEFNPNGKEIDVYLALDTTYILSEDCYVYDQRGAVLAIGADEEEVVDSAVALVLSYYSVEISLGTKVNVYVR